MGGHWYISVSITCLEQCNFLKTHLCLAPLAQSQFTTLLSPSSMRTPSCSTRIVSPGLRAFEALFVKLLVHLFMLMTSLRFWFSFHGKLENDRELSAVIVFAARNVKKITQPLNAVNARNTTPGEKTTSRSTNSIQNEGFNGCWHFIFMFSGCALP